jgi:hypothetical protein
MTRPPDAEGRRLAEAAPSTTPTAATTPKVGATIPDPGDGVSAASPLRRLLEETAATEGLSMKDLTVLAKQRDPFRLDTPANHRDGAWLATTVQELGLGSRLIHLRGIHYMVLGRAKPDGRPYRNTDDDWLWLSEDAAKAARWLGYLPFDQIIDKRNAAPTIRRWQPSDVFTFVHVGIDVEIPDVEDLTPQAVAVGFVAAQPYKLVMIGEKASLGDVLAPVAQARQADLFLPTGETSDTLIYQMAKVGAEDGRPMVVFYFADADPAGWQMGISLARKLQAFQALHFPRLEYEVRRVALTPDQIREYGLPSTPLKETEKRADAWRIAMRVEQTEIDALVALQPRLLRQLAMDAVAPYFDRTLAGRVQEAYLEWQERAQEALEEQLDSEGLERIRVEAAQKLEAIRAEIDTLVEALRVDTRGLRLPTPEVPEAEVDGPLDTPPLLDSAWPFANQCQRLIDSKAYRTDRSSPTGQQP